MWLTLSLTRVITHTWNATTDNNELQSDRCSLAGHVVTGKEFPRENRQDSKSEAFPYVGSLTVKLLLVMSTSYNFPAKHGQNSTSNDAHFD